MIDRVCVDECMCVCVETQLWVHCTNSLSADVEGTKIKKLQLSVLSAIDIIASTQANGPLPLTAIVVY